MLIGRFGGNRMRIVINDIAASSGGALTVLKSFYQHIKSSPYNKKHEWIFLLNSKYVEETENIKIIILNDVKKSWINRLKFDFINGKNIITKLKTDIVFSLQNTLTYGLKCPQIVYVHQSLPFQNVKKFSFFKKRERKLAIYQYVIGTIIKHSIRKANATIVQTKWMRETVINSINISSKRIIYIPLSQDDYSKFKRNEIFTYQNFFYPAANELYKNHKCIYDACELLNNNGLKNFKVYLTINKNNPIKNITFIGTLSFEQVLEEYNRSILIFPSYIETIGLPLLEAKQMGTIILVADCPYAREALEDYENVYYFNPFDPHELANLMQQVIEGVIIKEKTKIAINELNNGWEPIISLLEQISRERKNENTLAN